MRNVCISACALASSYWPDTRASTSPSRLTTSTWAYVGDSTNDQLMFAHFPHSIGVANIRRFEAELAHKPRYITASERGAGFSEVARAILDSKPLASKPGPH